MFSVRQRIYIHDDVPSGFFRPDRRKNFHSPEYVFNPGPVALWFQGDEGGKRSPSFGLSCSGCTLAAISCDVSHGLESQLSSRYLPLSSFFAYVLVARRFIIIPERSSFNVAGQLLGISLSFWLLLFSSSFGIGRSATLVSAYTLLPWGSRNIYCLIQNLQMSFGTFQSGAFISTVLNNDLLSFLDHMACQEWFWHLLLDAWRTLDRYEKKRGVI